MFWLAEAALAIDSLESFTEADLEATAGQVRTREECTNWLNLFEEVYFYAPLHHRDSSDEIFVKGLKNKG